jgi:hypothetical protein
MELVDGSAHRTELCEQLAMREYELDNLKDENIKLREERDHWHVEQVHAYGNWEDAYRRAAELEAENAKLRELVQIAIEYCVNGYCAEEDECPLYESRHSCRLYAKARELGVVEVDG